MEKNIQKIYDLLSENKHNLEDPSDKYAQGYNDAILDVLAIFGKKPESEKRYD